MTRRSQNIVIDFKNLLRICLIILDAELPLGKLYAVQRFLNCLSASCPKDYKFRFLTLCISAKI